MSIFLCGAARTAGHGSASGTILRIQRSYIPSRQFFVRSAKHSKPSSSFSTATRRPQKPPNASNTSTTAPTPAAAAASPAFWQRLGPLSTFFRFYSKSQATRPYATQFASSLGIFCAGDLGAQYIGGEAYDFKRTLRILAISAGSSVIIFRW